MKRSADFGAPVGGYLTPLIVRDADFTAVVWCDEEGIPKRLPENLWIRDIFSPSTPVLGTCVITGESDEDGFVTSVSPRVIELFKAHASSV